MKNTKVFVVAENERNIRAGHCYCCGDHVSAGNGYRVGIAGVGIRVVCPEHYADNGLIVYHGNARQRNNALEIKGTVKKTALASTTIGIELELYDNGRDGNDADLSAIRATFARCFGGVFESDCTVTAEHPTDPARGLGAYSKVLQRIEKQGDIHYFSNERCGAHVHVYCNDVVYVRRYYHSLFLPLQNYLDSLGHEKRVEYFGRDFGEWCGRIYDGCNAQNHSNFVNTQHANTLEFRLPRITGHKQYMQVLKFWRKCGLFINEFDFDKNNADNDARLARARECGAGLVEIAKHFYK